MEREPIEIEDNEFIFLATDLPTIKNSYPLIYRDSKEKIELKMFEDEYMAGNFVEKIAEEKGLDDFGFSFVLLESKDYLYHVLNSNCDESVDVRLEEVEGSGKLRFVANKFKDSPFKIVKKEIEQEIIK